MKSENSGISSKIAFIGGDSRMLAAAGALAAEENAECAVYGFEKYKTDSENFTRAQTPEDAVSGACAVVLPLPASKDGLRVFAPYAEKDVYLVSVLSLLNEDQLLLGGRTDIRINEVHKKTFDYFGREELRIMNAVPTAEGAIAIAMRELDITLHGARTAVLGFGRVGKALALRLRALGAKVCVCARSRSDLALADSLGMESADIRELCAALEGADCVFNTVPERILTQKELASVKRSAPLIELASAPGCADKAEAERAGVNIIPAPALPGKCAPVTAGRIIKSAICAILKEEGVL
ncbi:MAG: NAD(P)-binding domain-containing protein [Clostridia bacterium]|nr:NAD(P)-binding domain-containing protein [Clostridia bacterium]MBQ6183005.1 NAD(P)-binding domain-containing protein [Clostridia bacterium]